MTSNTTVVLAADTGGLTAALALAKAEAVAAGRELDKLARQAVQGGQALSSQLAPSINAAATRLNEAKGRMAELSVGLGDGAKAAEKMGHMSSGVTRELIVLGHEISQGNFSRFGGSMMVLAERMGGLSLATLGWGAAIAAAGYAAFELAKHFYEVEQAALHARDAFRFRGIDASKADIDDLIAGLMKIPHTTADAAQKAAVELAKLPAATKSLRSEVVADLGALAKGLNVDLPDAAKWAVKAFADLKDAGRQAIKDMGVAPAVLRDFDAAIGRGDQAAAYRILIQQLGAAVDRLGDGTTATAAASDILRARQALGLPVTKEVTAAVNEHVSALRNQVLATRDAAGANPTTKPQTGVPVEQVRLQLEQLRQDTSKTNNQILADEVSTIRQRIAEYEKLGQDATELKREEARLVAEQNRATSQDAVAKAREANATIAGDTTRSAVERLRAEEATLKQLLDGDKLTGDARVEIRRQIAEKESEIARQSASEQQAITRSNAETDLAIGRTKIEAQKSALDMEVQANQVSAAQKLTILRNLTNEEFQLNLRALENELAGLRSQPVEYARVYNEIRLLKAKNAADLAALDRQAALDARKQAKDQSRTWKDAFGEIASAESTLVSGIISGRQTMGQIMLQISGQMIERELANDLHYLTARLFYSQAELAADKSIASGGLLVHLAAESGKTAATATGEATRTAATAAGAAERTGIETTAAGESIALSIATGIKDIAIKAAQAFAGAYAAIAAIPYVGPVLAPVAAAGAFAGVIAIGKSIASAEGGMLTVPDDMLANIHKDESVLPANIAGPMRDFFTGGGQGSGGPVNVTFQINAIDTQTGAQFIKSNARAIAQTVAGQIRNFNPSLKPARA